MVIGAARSWQHALVIRSRGQSLLVAAATLWGPLYLMAFVVVVFVIVIGGPGPESSGGPPARFVTRFALHHFTIVLGLALLVVYLVDVFRNPDLEDEQDLRIMWVLLVVLAGPFAMPVYWWLFLRPGSASFAARATVGS